MGEYTPYFIGIGVFLIVSVLVAIKIQKAGYTDKRLRDARKAKKYVKMYIFFEKFPLTTRRVRKISNKLLKLSVLSQQETYALSVKVFIKGIVIIAVLLLGCFWLFDDTMSRILCVVFGFVVSSVLADKQVDKLNTMVLESLRVYIGALREEYLRLGSVAEALQETECDNLLRGMIDNIHNIITTSNSEVRLKEFFERTPFKPMQTLARICYNINNSGDSVDENNESNFIKSLKFMSEDLNSDLEKIDYRKKTFGFIEYLCVFPIPAIKLCEIGFQSIIPGMSIVYNGMLGYIIKIVILISCVIGYSVITKINTSITIKEDDRNYFILGLLKFRAFKNFVAGAEAKNVKRRILTRKIQAALSKKSISEIYAAKILYSFAIFIASLITFALMVQISFKFITTNTAVMGMVNSNDTKDYSDEFLQQMDLEYFDILDDIGEREVDGEIVSPTESISYEQSLEFVEGRLTTLNDLQLQDQINRMNKKYDQINDTYFKWYYVIAALLLGVIGWFIPNIIIKARTWLAKTEAQEDFLQLQTLMTIIACTDADNIDALEQMCQLSKIHKTILIYCYHSYPSNPHMELARLASRTPLPEFKRFIQKMDLAVDDLDLRESFSDLEIERNYILDMRDRAIKASIDSKRGKCGLISRVPMVALFIGMLVIPILYVGIEEFSKAMASLSGM